MERKYSLKIGIVKTQKHIQTYTDIQLVLTR
nr:MAG TPA: hypothetical protein [Caudoviricetes sp.]